MLKEVIKNIVEFTMVVEIGRRRLELGVENPEMISRGASSAYLSDRKPRRHRRIPVTMYIPGSMQCCKSSNNGGAG